MAFTCKTSLRIFALLFFILSCILIAKYVDIDSTHPSIRRDISKRQFSADEWKLSQIRLDNLERSIPHYNAVLSKSSYAPKISRFLSTSTSIESSVSFGRLLRLSAIVNHKYKLVMCTVPKIACTQWRRFLLLLEHPELESDFDNWEVGKNYTGRGKTAIWNKRLNASFTAPNVHNYVKEQFNLLNFLPMDQRFEIYNNAKYLKVMHVRNPITRFLSAWLSKVTDVEYQFFNNRTFPELVEFAITQDPLQLDEHIVPMYYFCDVYHGANYDLFLKFEERSYWQPLLFQYFQFDQRIIDKYMKISKETGASDLAILAQHYTPDTFDAVANLYAVDIDMFGYVEEVEAMRLLLFSQ